MVCREEHNFSRREKGDTVYGRHVIRLTSWCERTWDTGTLSFGSSFVLFRAIRDMKSKLKASQIT